MSNGILYPGCTSDVLTVSLLDLLFVSKIISTGSRLSSLDEMFCGVDAKTRADTSMKNLLSLFYR